MSSQPEFEDHQKLDRLSRAVGDACRSQWELRAVRGVEWLDIPLAPQATIDEALLAAWELGVRAGQRDDRAATGLTCVTGADSHG